MLSASAGQGYSALTARTQSLSTVVKLRCFIDFQLVGKTNRLAYLKHRFQFRCQPIILPKEKPFKVSSFKGNGQNDGVDDVERDHKFSQKPIRLSTTPHKREDTATASPDIPSDSLSYGSGNGEASVSGSQSIERLFKKWLSMLSTQTSNEPVDEIYGKRSVESRSSENQKGIVIEKVVNLSKVAFLWFMRLDATIMIPLIIFIPWYLITRVVYGTEVTKELTPLWILGPLIAALYIKIIQGIWSLYIFCFKQFIRFVENVPSYYMLVYSYIGEGQLRAFLYARFCQPMVDLKNADYRALAGQKANQLKEWAVEKYLDYVESIWPYYCRTIRFLKKANLL